MKTQFCMSTAKVLGLSLSLACPEVFNSTFSEHFSLPTHLESSSFPLSQSICSFSRAIVNTYLATFLVNYVYPPSWNGHPASLWGRNMQEIYAHSFFRKWEGFSSGWPCCTAQLCWLFKVPTCSVWLSKVLDTSVAVCRGVYTCLFLPEFNYSWTL